MAPDVELYGTGANAESDETAKFDLSAIREARASEPRDVACLSVVEGLEAGCTVRVDGGAILLGRDPACHLRLSDSGLSRLHARVEQDQSGSVVLVDADSTNGTFVNGQRIRSHVLADNDHIQLGPITIVKFGLHTELESRVLVRQYEQSIRDDLTGVFNRRHFAGVLRREIAYAVRHREPVSVVLLDLDHFKRINDSLGHLAGDSVLRQTAQGISHCLRTEDLFARYGGEEFAFVLRGLNASRAYKSAERIRIFIEGMQILWENQAVPVTASMGTATLAPGERKQPADLIQEADARLYEAKATGRNRTVSEA